jgi:hypothetical protein
MSLTADLRALRKANVRSATFFEDGGLQSVEFMPAYAKDSAPASPTEPGQPRVSVTGGLPAAETEAEPGPKPPKDLIQHVLLAELPPVELDGSDFPEATEEVDYGTDEPAAEPSETD